MKLLRFAGYNLFSLGRVELNLANRGVLLITGYSEDDGSANGAGKSSLASKAPVWVLWGLTPGGLKADNVINRHGKRKCWGVVYFIGIDGETYMVRRERPAKLSLFKGSEQGQDLSLKKASDTQALIDKLLGRDFKTFIQTDFFGQGRALSYASLAPKEQKALLENILPMQQIDAWAEYAGEQLHSLIKLQADQTTKVDKLRYQHTTQVELNDSLKAKAAEWATVTRTNIAATEKKIIGIDTTTETTRLEITNLDEEINKLNKDAPKQDNKIADAMLAAQKKIDDSLHQYSTASKSVSAWQARLAGYEASNLDGVNVAKKICPLCLSDISDDTHESLVLRQKKLEGLKDEATLNITQAKEAEGHYHKEYQTSRDQIGPLYVIANEQVAQVKYTAGLVSKKTKLEQSIVSATDQLHYELKQQKEAINPWPEEIEKVTKKCNSLDIDIEGEGDLLFRINDEVKHVTFWHTFFSKELKLQLFEATCPFLGERTAYHLEGLKNGQIHAEFNTIKRLATGEPRDEFTVRVWSETGGDGFDSLSGGEQQIVSFAIGLALADLASSQAEGESNFLILDEPFSQLDGRNSEAIVEYLTSDLGKTKETILLISNEEELKTLIPNRVHIIKKHGVSNIEV